MHYEDTYNRIIDLASNNKEITRNFIYKRLLDIPERDVKAVITDIEQNFEMKIEQFFNKNKDILTKEILKKSSNLIIGFFF